jgi:hypothetical protein
MPLRFDWIVLLAHICSPSSLSLSFTVLLELLVELWNLAADLFAMITVSDSHFNKKLSYPPPASQTDGGRSVY